MILFVNNSVLTRLLCNPAIDFDQPILNFKSNVHLAAIAKLRGDIVTPVVWESTNGEDAKTVLHNFKTIGQETLADLIGKFQYSCSFLHEHSLNKPFSGEI